MNAISTISDGASTPRVRRRMKTALAIAVPGVVLLAVGMHYLAERLSSDAIGLALGLGFGVLAGIPAALLVFVASRSRPPYDYGDDYANAPTPFSTLPIAPPSAGDNFRVIEQAPRQAPLARSGRPAASTGGTSIRWPEPVPCVLLWPGRPPQLGWSQFTMPLDEALASGGICYVLESEWNQYVAAQQRGRL